MTTPALFLPSLKLSDDESAVYGALRSRLNFFAPRNKVKNQYYEAKQTVRKLDIAVPPQLSDLHVAVGWPGTVVDVLEERLDLLGWGSTSDLMGLDEVFVDNQLAIESGQGHLDTLINGTDFVSVGRGSDDEPDVLVTVESASSATGLWDQRTRRLSSAMSETRDEFGRVLMETLYLPDETIVFQRNAITGTVEIISRDPHGMGRVPVARLRNRERASRIEGRSEITKAVQYYTDAAVRTMLGMEINREFYTAPQRYALGATPEQFGVDEDASPEELKRAGWRVTMGHLNILPRDEDSGELPQMGEFSPKPPTPYIEQVKAYSMQLAAESGIPATYLGFVTDNPSSADAIRQAEYRLVKRAERRQTSFGQAWLEVAYLALLVRDGEVDRDKFRGIYVDWRDASTPTRAAAADEATKLIAAGVFPPDSGVTYDRIGLTRQDQERLSVDRRNAAARTAMDTILNRVSQRSAAPTDAAPTETIPNNNAGINPRP